LPEFKERRLVIAARLHRTYASPDILTPAQARAFVRCLQTEWEVPVIDWSTAQSKDQIADAYRLIHAAGTFREIDGPDSARAMSSYRRAGEILEWLSRADDTASQEKPILLFAAGAFQLAKLPAMASAILKRVQFEAPGLELYARFLRADFDGVLRAVGKFWKAHPDLTTRDAPKAPDADEGEEISWFLTVELVRSIGLIADSLRRGENSRLDRGINKLVALDKLALRAMREDSALLIELLMEVAKGYREASIYGAVRLLAAGQQADPAKIEHFARVQFNRERGILWSSQQQGIQKLLGQSSFALCTPTGSGKTLVANLALIKELLLTQYDEISPLAIYLVPSRALAGEVEGKLVAELGSDLIITGLYGGNDWGITDYWLDADKPTVLIATVEKADALMRYLGPLLLRRLVLLIVDEAHQVVVEDGDSTRESFADHSSRALRLEGFVSRLLLQKPEIARIALTAVAGGAANPVARWIEGHERAEALGIQYRSTRQLIGTLETRYGGASKMLIDLMNGQPLHVRGRGDPLYIGLRIPRMPDMAAPLRASIARVNQMEVLWTSLHLMAGDRRILISIAQRPEQTMGWFKEALELESWTAAKFFKPPTEGPSKARFDEALAACVDYCGQHSYEAFLLAHGIATSHGQMPQRLRRLMTDLIDRGICPITLATATLTEGVNLPFDIVFVTSLNRSRFNPLIRPRQTIVPLSTAEFRNLAGRAGRPGSASGIEGITLVALPQIPAATADAPKRIQRGQIQQFNNSYEALRRDLLADASGIGIVNSPLAMLITAIFTSARSLFNLTEVELFQWLEVTLPDQISSNVGDGINTPDARLADSLDELDCILLTALEELASSQLEELKTADAEELLSQLWRRTFTSFAAEQETWMEKVFVKRGYGIVNNIYTDAQERTRLYRYGFTPCIGKKFEATASKIGEVFEASKDYNFLSEEQKLEVFIQLGELVSANRGFGFRVRDTVSDQAIFDGWESVLGWWMHVSGASPPEPSELRSWQRFVSDNLEFRLGVALGAVVAQRWSEGADDPLAIPSLESWRETTGLPWFAFWARELLRWGTLDPFVAFCLARGLSKTRADGAARRYEFETWLEELDEDFDAEDSIDPKLFSKWERSLSVLSAIPASRDSFDVQLTGTSGVQERYSVLPIRDGTIFIWLDAAGFELARCGYDLEIKRWASSKYDFFLDTTGDTPQVKRERI
jgi:hypothetical protein